MDNRKTTSGTGSIANAQVNEPQTTSENVTKVVSLTEYNLELSKLHGTRKLDYIRGNNNKVNELFSQIDGDIKMLTSGWIEDISFIQSLENDIKRLCEWTRQNTGIFRGNQYELCKKKFNLFKKLLDGKYEWLSKKNVTDEENELKMEVRKWKQLAERYKSQLIKAGIKPDEPQTKKQCDNFNPSEFESVVWNIVNSNSEVAKAKNEIEKWLNAHYGDAWMGDDIIVKNWKRANSTARMYVSYARFIEKQSSVKPAVTQENVEKWCKELKEIEDHAHYDLYTEKFEEYQRRAEQGGYSKLFKKLTSDNAQKEPAGLMKYLDTEALSPELTEYFSKDEMELTPEGTLKRLLKAKDYALYNDPSHLYHIYQKTVREMFKDNKKQDEWLIKW